MKNRLVEICSYSVQSAINAYKAGADRVELCDNMAEGGTTPSMAAIKLARKLIPIKINVIIRPRGGDFCYSGLEFEEMKYDIELYKDAGVDGFVFGILTETGHVDVKRIKELIKIARPHAITFHRAFDMTENPYYAMASIIDMGIERILTSGQAASAYVGRRLLASLIEKAGSDIIIMPGGGINEENIIPLLKETGACEFHLSARKYFPGRMIYRHENVFFNSDNLIPEYDIQQADPEVIEKVVTLVKGYDKTL